MLLLIRQPAIKSERAGLGQQDIEWPTRSNFNRETGEQGKKITGIPVETRDLVRGAGASSSPPSATTPRWPWSTHSRSSRRSPRSPSSPRPTRGCWPPRRGTPWPRAQMRQSLVVNKSWVRHCHGRRRFLAPRSSEGCGEGAGEGREWLTVDAAPAKPPATSGIGRRRLVWVLVLVWLGG